MLQFAGRAIRFAQIVLRIVRFPFIRVIVRIGRLRIDNAGTMVPFGQILYQVLVVIVVNNFSPIDQYFPPVLRGNPRELSLGVY